MEKPIRPIEPDVFDRVKYPREIVGKNHLGRPVTGSPRFINDYKTYQKELSKYESDILLYEQIKFINDIKRSTLKLCLKKYEIWKKN